MHSSRIRKKVKDDYKQIAEEFSSSRKFPWADFDLFNKFYNSNSSVLDLGCGNGRLLGYLEKHGFESYLGVDQSEELIKEARKLHKHNDFKIIEMSNLHGLKGKYDAIFAIASFHHIPPKLHVRTLKKWKKHLKPGGKLFMTNWNLHQKKYLPLLLRSILFPSYGFRGVLVPWKNQLNRYYFAFTKRKLNKILKKVGFKIYFQDYVRDGIHATVLTGKNIIIIAE